MCSTIKNTIRLNHFKVGRGLLLGWGTEESEGKRKQSEKKGKGIPCNVKPSGINIVQSSNGVADDVQALLAPFLIITFTFVCCH